jgi:hypothetical protein
MTTYSDYLSDLLVGAHCDTHRTDGYRQIECGRADFDAMLSAHAKVKREHGASFELAVSGWTMGPGPESFPPGNASILNNWLPANVTISAINPECGNVPPNPGLAAMTKHQTWTVSDGIVYPDRPSDRIHLSFSRSYPR